MEEKIYYNSIFKRKSIRKYKPEPLDNNQLFNIREHVKNIMPLYPGIKTEITIALPNDVKGFIQVKAPHYIIAFSETIEGHLTNIGFMLQQMDLFFSANGIGSCWQGWPKPTKELRDNQNLEFIIALAFGMPNEKIHRESVDQFKRKPLDQITDAKNFLELIEAARLAPSPSQPWYFTAEGNVIYICCKKSGSLITMVSRHLDTMEKRLQSIEIGIATCHLWIAAQHFNKKTEFLADNNESRKNNIPKGYFYVLSINIQ